MRNIFLGIFILLFAVSLSAQNKYWVVFTDKGNHQFSLNNPSQFLSENAIARRQFFEIPISITDIPVHQNYIEKVIDLDADISKKSKWLNGAIFHSDNPHFYAQVKQLEFVKEVIAFKEYTQKSTQSKFNIEDIEVQNEINFSETEYGNAFLQINMLSGQFLHDLDFQGQNIDIAIMDNGFLNVNNNRFFEAARLDNRLHSGFNFVNNSNTVYGNGTHGAWVLSTIAPNVIDTFIGTAPLSNFYLFVTEDENAEGQQEEINWAMAAEWADSALGTWVVLNTSLGYSNGFNDGSENYTYVDMDGNTTIITKAADLAAQKGMLVVNSAGNEGRVDWKYITAPADGDSVLTIGAVDVEGSPADFSSYGPSYDGRIKPNVSALGAPAQVIEPDGRIVNKSGTSFSGPITAGLAACLWQAFPNKNNMEIIKAIEQSAHLFYAPEEQYGFGIPNFEKAYQILALNETVTNENNLIIYPNPVDKELKLVFLNNNTEKYNYLIADMNGKVWLKENNKTNTYDDPIGVENLPKGVYSIFIKQGKNKFEKKFVKN